MSDLQRRFEETPLTFAILFAYVALGVATNALQPDGLTMVRFGAAVPILIQDGDWWRLITNAFLHFGLVHLLLNSYALYLFGPGLERSLGTTRFAVLYGVTAVAGTVAAIFTLHPLGFVVGGSGALFGMMGAMLALVARSGRTRLGFLRDHFARYLMMLIGLNLVLGFVIPGISNAAHVGGLVTGFVLVYVFFDTGRERVDAAGRAIQAGCAAVFVAFSLYTLFPVLRWDYQLKLSVTANSEETRAIFVNAVGHLTHDDVEFLTDRLTTSFGERGARLADEWFR